MVYLRPLQTDDVSQRYVDWLNDPEVNRFMETRHSRQTLETVTDYVRHMDSRHDQHIFAICRAESEEHIGNAKLGPVHPRYLHGDISLFIGEKRCWGRGYATQVVSVLTFYGFEVLGLNKLRAGCYESNLGSLGAFERSGYRREGLLRDEVLLEGSSCGVILLGMTADDYRACRSRFSDGARRSLELSNLNQLTVRQQY